MFYLNRYLYWKYKNASATACVCACRESFSCCELIFHNVNLHDNFIEFQLSSVIKYKVKCQKKFAGKMETQRVWRIVRSKIVRNWTSTIGGERTTLRCGATLRRCDTYMSSRGGATLRCGATLGWWYATLRRCDTTWRCDTTSVWGTSQVFGEFRWLKQKWEDMTILLIINNLNWLLI